MLGSGDVLVVLLDRAAGAFWVPSKTLSYLCAGRPVLGLMPAENLAAQLVEQVDGCVLPPSEESLDDAAAWVAGVLRSPVRQQRLGEKARALAEREFALKACATRFEEILSGYPARLSRMSDMSLVIRDDRSLLPGEPFYSQTVFTTLLTRRRAVDHCRVHSSLCRTS